MIFNINSTRGQTRFLTCVARETCLVWITIRWHYKDHFANSSCQKITGYKMVFFMTADRNSYTSILSWVHCYCQLHLLVTYTNISSIFNINTFITYRSRRKTSNAMRQPCDILMYLSCCNSYSRQSVLTLHVRYGKINLSIYLSTYLPTYLPTYPSIFLSMYLSIVELGSSVL